MLESILRTLTLVLVTTGLTYLFTSVGLGLRMNRRLAKGTVVLPPPLENASVFVMIPCLDEAEVIGATVSALLAQQGSERATIIVIDDDSSDATADIVESFADANVLLCRRRLPAARLGKGVALNDGLTLIKRLAAQRGLSSDSVIVCVLDADGRLSEGTLARAGEPFGDPKVGGVQLAVRIRNRTGRNPLPKMQDLEFWALSATTQAGRMGTQTVSLGGNGQFSRLSALESVGEAPWSDALTEDLDLAISLAIRGWKLTSLPNAYVDQQGLTSTKLLFKQRTRWFQGHMATGKRIAEIWRSPEIDNAAALELSTYLLVPWVFVLPWSIVGHYALYQSLRLLFQPVADNAVGGRVVAQLALVAFWYVTGFLPNIILGWIYFRRDRKVGRLRAFALAHLMIPYNYLGYAAAWRAFWRILTHKTGWAKTARVSEGVRPETVAARLFDVSPLPVVVGGAAMTAAAGGDRQDDVGVDLVAVGSFEGERDQLAFPFDGNDERLLGEALVYLFDNESAA